MINAIRIKTYQTKKRWRYLDKIIMIKNKAFIIGNVTLYNSKLSL